VTADPRFTIRPLRPADDDAVAHIIRTVMPEFGAEGPGFAINDPEVDAMSAHYVGPGHAFFVVEMDGRVVGSAGIAPLTNGPEGVCELRKMYFLPPARGIGAGSAMMATCLDFARRAGYRQCYLETLAGMDAAGKLYRRTGFKPLCGPLGATGHFSCDSYYLMDL
jgi:putative acetyltransferase